MIKDQVPKDPELKIRGASSLVLKFIIPGTPPNTEKPFSEKEAFCFLLNCLETLKLVHGRGILHRDIKPDNIIIHQHTREPWLIDFGIAKKIELSSMGKNTKIGTPRFSAPEISSHGIVGTFSDIFSLGATILYLTGSLGSEAEWDEVLQHRKF